jgi:glycine hydroxymethyltransferase
MIYINQQDKELGDCITREEKRQQDGLELIPSENYVSQAVREALGSVFTNKYSEGYPGRRYYGGQENTDGVERLAMNRARELFDAKYVNVQPLSGAPANIAMYFALLNPGDTVLGMDLSHGGHLTHGHPVTAATKVFRFVRYGMKNIDTGEIDYDALHETARREKPKILLAGYSSYPREIDYARFVSIARDVGAYAVMDIAHISGLIAGKAVTNPFDFGFDVLTTTTHKTLRGPRGGMILTRDNEDIAKKIDKSVFPGLQGGPHMNVIAAKAVAFGEALHPKFRDYSLQVLKNAQAMGDVFMKNGIRLITGGTSNHLILADVFGSLGVSGAEAELALDEIGITVNKNVIPDDVRRPLDPSGIRFGTPAITTRGFKESECAEIANCMVSVLQNISDEKHKMLTKKQVTNIAHRFPVPDRFV